MPYRISARPPEKPEYTHSLWRKLKRALVRAFVRVNLFSHKYPIWPFFPLHPRWNNLIISKDGGRFIKKNPEDIHVPLCLPPKAGDRVDYIVTTNPMPPPVNLSSYIYKQKSVVLYPWDNSRLRDNKSVLK